MKLSEVNVHGATKFTFHYVSILIIKTVFLLHIICIYIPLCLYFNINAVVQKILAEKFTFHYVSILIGNAGRQKEKQLYLHSIMSLF